MKELGVDSQPLLARHDIDVDVLTNPDQLISLSAAIELLEDSAVASKCPSLGLRLATQQDVGMLGIIAVVIQNAPTVMQAAEDATRFLFLHSPAMEIVVDRPSYLHADCVSLRLTIRQSVYAPQRQAIDAAVGYMWKLVMLLSGGNARLHGVSLPHSPLARESVYRRFFGAAVYFAQPCAALHIHQDILSASLEAVNPLIRQLALDHIHHRASPHVPMWSDRVRQAISGSLGANKGSKLEIAKILGMHPRTLQRRLDSEGQKFEEIRENVLSTTALRFLLETDIPLKQIADLLGYEGQAAFTRSCQRWFGESPSGVRKSKRGSSPL